MALVDVKALHKSFTSGGETTHVLRGSDLTVERGEMVMVMGPSGSGKTTLLNLLGGIDKADKGRICVDGSDLNALKGSELNRYRREKVGFIFQFYNLIPTLTSLENVELGMESRGLDRGTIREKARRYLDMVGMTDKENSYPQELSGGQQQRVAVARALCKEPKLILADEPTGNLDEEHERNVMGIMKDLQKELGISFLLVSHNNRLRSYVDRTLMLRHGVLSPVGK